MEHGFYRLDALPVGQTTQQWDFGETFNPSVASAGTLLYD